MVNSGLLKFNENSEYPIVEVPYVPDGYNFSDHALLDITYKQIAELLKNDQIVCFRIPAEINDSLNIPLTFVFDWYALNESGELTEIEAIVVGAFPEMRELMQTWLGNYNIDNQNARVYLMAD